MRGVFSFMAHKPSSVLEPLIAQETDIWFIIRMCALVGFQTVTLGKHSIAHLTLVYDHLEVDLLVPVHCCAILEAFAAHVTLEWPFPGVRPHVCVQCAVLGKPFETDFTGEGFFSGMDSHMNRYAAAVGESLVTYGASERPLSRMSSPVSCKCATFRKLLFT